MNNGRRYALPIKSKAVVLRKNGMTHGEIARHFGISRSTAGAWTKGIALTSLQKNAMHQRISKRRYSPEIRRQYSERAKIQLAPYHIKYSEENLIQKIKDFHNQHGRIPLKREFNMYDEYKRRFGSWNAAIAAAGFEPHKVIFSKKFTAKDGHVCDSFAERIIDDWLYKNGVNHIRNAPYPGTKLTVDFAIGDIRIEYFGLAGEISGYDRTIKRKREICKETNLHLIELYPTQLFSKNFKNCLGDILAKIKQLTTTS